MRLKPLKVVGQVHRRSLVLVISEVGGYFKTILWLPKIIKMQCKQMSRVDGRRGSTGNKKGHGGDTAESENGGQGEQFGRILLWL